MASSVEQSAGRVVVIPGEGDHDALGERGLGPHYFIDLQSLLWSEWIF